MMRLEFHPAASDEVEAAHRWYAERSPIAAARFLEELDAAVADIQTRPECGAPYLHGTRCYLLRRFPILSSFIDRARRPSKLLRWRTGDGAPATGNRENCEPEGVVDANLSAAKCCPDVTRGRSGNY
jgi:plasmid stabilization system protein ParE